MITAGRKNYHSFEQLASLNYVKRAMYSTDWRPVFVERFMINQSIVTSVNGIFDGKTTLHTGTYVFPRKIKRSRALVPVTNDTPPDLRGLIIDIEV